MQPPLPAFLAIFALSNQNNLVMIPFCVVRSIERKCRELQCPECGGHHDVSIECSGDVVCPHFNGACNGFRREANNLIADEIRRFLNDPLPHLR